METNCLRKRLFDLFSNSDAALRLFRAYSGIKKYFILPILYNSILVEHSLVSTTGT